MPFPAPVTRITFPSNRPIGSLPSKAFGHP
jgi:hypothetical protein